MDQSVSPPDAKSTPQPASHVPRAVPPVGILPRVGGAGRRAGLARALLRPRSLGIAALLGIALVYGGRELHLRLTHVYEYDARVTADVVTISSRADGWVTDLAVREGMKVEAGQVLSRSTTGSPSSGSARCSPRSRKCRPNAPCCAPNGV